MNFDYIISLNRLCDHSDIRYIHSDAWLAYYEFMIEYLYFVATSTYIVMTLSLKNKIQYFFIFLLQIEIENIKFGGYIHTSCGGENNKFLQYLFCDMINTRRSLHHNVQQTSNKSPSVLFWMHHYTICGFVIFVSNRVETFKRRSRHMVWR